MAVRGNLRDLLSEWQDRRGAFLLSWDLHGEWRTYNENGQLIGLASYKEGQKDGPWRIWSDKGNLLYEMFYTAGKKSGVWRSWDEEGNLLSEENQ